MTSEISKELKEIINIAQEAGKILMKYYKKEFDISYKKSYGSGIVTTADLESNKYITAQIREKFPNDKLLSEEESSHLKDFSGRVWIIDPLDGTSNFAKHYDNFSVLIGLCIDGVPVLGVLYAPVRDITYYAEKNKGAFMITQDQTQKISVSKNSSISKSRLVNQAIIRERTPLESYVESLNFSSVIREKSFGLKIMVIARGDAEILLGWPKLISRWDACAPQIILEEAGGIISDLDGNSLDYNIEKDEWEHIIIATNGHIHKIMLEKIKEFENQK